MPSPCALVWFKRDLRVHDHAALVAAQPHPRALAVFVVEPEWLNSPECDASHVDFALACLAELRAALAQRGMPLLVRKLGPSRQPRSICFPEPCDLTSKATSNHCPANCVRCVAAP